MKSSAKGAGTRSGSTSTKAAPKSNGVAGKSSTSPGHGSKPPVAPLLLPAISTLIFAAFALLARINANPHLEASFLGSAGVLLAGLGVLWWTVSRSGRALTYEFFPRRVHWVQMIMHSSVYAYWGWYWREVYHEIPLILAQVFFLYALDMIVCWFRRDKWILGFGPIPIIFSMNLFLWFRDDWFYLQFVMIAIIVFGKEFLRWNREGRLTHIFNPSAFALFLTSIVLLLTHNTGTTWGIEISTTFFSPPYIYAEIFLLGLIVQGLFSVTLVTLSAAASLCALNLIYHGATGLYFFVDTNINPAVFLGLHLLVTDPATSPRKNFGKAIFGAAYGAGVFMIFGLLDSLGQPSFYDKLLCVPALNLTVRALDRLSTAVGAWFSRQKFGQLRPMQALAGWTPQQANFGFMGIWVAFFAVMIGTGFLASSNHPGSYTAFWDNACNNGRTKACQVLDRLLDVECQHDSARGCFNLGVLLSDGKRLPRNPVAAAWGFGHACDQGVANGCSGLVSLVKSEGDGILMQPCSHGDGSSCFMLGSLYHGVAGLTPNLVYAANLFQQSCTDGFTRGCGKLGESYLFGQGVPEDIVKARQILEKACDSGYGAGCFNVGIMHRDGIQTPVNAQLAMSRFRQGCQLGDQNSCASAGLKARQ